MANENTINDSDIAIIGMSCRFPGANSTDAFWQNLSQGKESVSFFSDKELKAEGVAPDLLCDPNYVKAGTVLQNYNRFDASFFGYTPREAELLDPQHRLFLECSWEAIENAGYDTSSYQGAVGVFAGSGMNFYLLNNLYPNRELSESVGAYQLFLENRGDFLSTRVSYKMNLRGPSVNVQTACSTSLVAVHLACQSLHFGDCDIALAGGVSIQVPHKTGYLYQEDMIMSPDGHCRAFSTLAQGTVGGNGLGIVVLKLLKDAVTDRDTVHAVIKGSAINNDGSLKVNYTAPNINAQAGVIREARMVAGIEPETISYIEAHGTATILGDPIEIAALTQGFNTERKTYCAIGSVKTNIGHADAAAGVAGLIKTVLSLRHRQIPPSLHFDKPNPKIDFENSPFYVNTELAEWKSNGILRRAGVSSFGVGGTNAHVVLEEAPERSPSDPSRHWQLLLFSAKTPSALDNVTANLADYIKQNPDTNLADAAYTLATGRQRHPFRRMLVCRELKDASQRLDGRDSKKRLHRNLAEADDRPVVFMFPGQGAQYAGMGRELYEVEPVFREHVDLCAEILGPMLDLDLRDLLYPEHAKLQEAGCRLEQTAITQPAVFVISYALAQLWMSWGVKPRAMIGHSIGEYVAAALSGVFSLPDALKLVAARGRMMQRLPEGAMLAVSLSEADVIRRIRSARHSTGVLSLAAVNGVSQCVVSGHAQEVEKFRKRLMEMNVAAVRLHTSHAFHSEMMEPILTEFAEQAGTVVLHPPGIPYISNMTGTWMTAEDAVNPDYWAGHLRRTVRFCDGFKELSKEPERIYLEVGPGRTLTTLAKQHPNLNKQAVFRSLRHPRETESDTPFLLASLGKLWIAGSRIDWEGFYQHERRRRIPLPTYPFEGRRYWIDSLGKAAGTSRMDLSGSPKKQGIENWFYIPAWERSFALPYEKSVLLSAPENNDRLLLFADECGLGYQLARKLEAEGRDVITVQAGAEYARADERTYVLDPERREDYDELMQDLLHRGGYPRTIVHMWRVTSTAGSPTDDTAKAGLALGFYSLLFLTGALGRITAPIQLIVVTDNMREVTGEETVHPEKATVLSPVNVIPQEHPNIRCRSIDLVLEGEVNASSPVVGQLLAELKYGVSDSGAGHPGNRFSREVAYRGRHRWERTYKQLSVSGKNLPDDRTGEMIKTGGVYLITGGLGRIGLVLADHLASVQAKLILVGRSEFPDRGAWEEWLSAHDDNDEISRTIQKIRGIEQSGAEVLVIRADVADPDGMQTAIHRSEEHFGPLNGVIHAAGITRESFQFIGEISPEACEKHFRPKIDGLFILKKVLRNKTLDFCILFSSLSSVLGGLGFAAYSAANLFMDAFVRCRNRENGARWISVNWDGWQIEKENDADSAASSFGASARELAMTPEEGIKVFRRLAALFHNDRIIVSTGALQARIEKWTNFDVSRRPGNAPAGGSSSVREIPGVKEDDTAPRNRIERRMVDIWEELFGIEQISITDDFWELGGHSLLGTQLISRIRQEFQISLSLQIIFEEPTVGGLSGYIETRKRIAQRQPIRSEMVESEFEEGII